MHLSELLSIIGIKITPQLSEIIKNLVFNKIII